MDPEPQQPQETRVKRRRGGTRKKTGWFGFCFFFVSRLNSLNSFSFTCKARHTHCDEKKPVCSNCERLGLECRASEFIARSAWCSTDKGKSKRRGSLASPNSAVSADIQVFGPPTSTWDIFRSSWPDSKNFSESANASSASSVLSTSPVTPVPTLQPTTSQQTVPLSPETVFLLNEYQRGLAKWMDLFDHGCTYQRHVCRRALTSDLLLKCICAFTARQLCLLASGEIWSPVATKYYSQALNLLIKQLNSPEPRGDELTAVMLLSSYEVLAAQGQEHRRHYEGAMKLIRMQGISARSIGLDRANFWIWIRHEIAVSIMNETPLQMSPRYWNVSWRDGETEEDSLGNHVLWLVGRAVDWVFGKGTPREYHDLLRDTERWHSGLSATFRGVKYGDPVEDGIFKVYFAVPAAAAAMLWFHLLHILLYAEPVLKDATYAAKVQAHATEVINISISDIADQARCFSIIPLYFAGKHVNSIVRKTRVWVLLDDIQTELGYHTRSSIEGLQKLLDPASRKDRNQTESTTLS
ncbi:hypothetical protein LOZ12_000273 [Ophidiomyces ophidiicola]|uniref:Uncharacterized protein n=1 Tax=Ophidiomyces ophidiicola TaxID=1387563 RepID=A0ACB8V3N3_9EURO|nr:hypothetical protein LOZ64_000614 [Ophidiomyces ophidiicola]KAI1952264.1 hypothetical protein LOZ62_001394 [Ophidiomyces ophidiicola]KAI1975424.1 hypothetical protein LOZ56_000623 [Ophidiomyces ophidiicola]KAI2002622.1 hypothetical protein LOZ50_004884 [Ophidiomyces ophidiicola]KAI2015850.1 hypothetical protein LOZ49_000435 [Ophidiomyces ophidiicola]